VKGDASECRGRNGLCKILFQDMERKFTQTPGVRKLKTRVPSKTRDLQGECSERAGSLRRKVRLQKSSQDMQEGPRKEETGTENAGRQKLLVSVRYRKGLAV